MYQFHENPEMKPDVSESFLRHMEETTELLENPYSKTLLEKVVKHIRELKKKDHLQKS